MFLSASRPLERVVENLERYVDEIVAPTINDFEENPTSVRHAFLGCVATFHAIDYLAETVGCS
jgi:hypothetical protein